MDHKSMMFNLLSSAFHIVSLMLSNILTIILLKYQSSILYINRTILNYLNMALIITMNISVNEQSIHSIFRVVFGPFSQEYAFCARAVLVLCFFTFNLIFFTLNTQFSSEWLKFNLVSFSLVWSITKLNAIQFSLVAKG